MDILNSFRKRQIAHRTTTLKTKKSLDKEIKSDEKIKTSTSLQPISFPIPVQTLYHLNSEAIDSTVEDGHLCDFCCSRQTVNNYMKSEKRKGIIAVIQKLNKLHVEPENKSQA